jgi:hypothetical protein
MRRAPDHLARRDIVRVIMTTLRVLVFAAVTVITSALTVTDLASHAFAAAQTAKQQCMNSCRARYRDCRHQNQLPSSECQGIYQDCTRYTCTGLGPG